MGDRCYMWVIVRKDDAPKFLGFLPRGWADQIEESDLAVTLVYEQANYGYGEELSRAAAAGCEFYGHHGQGSSYDGAEFHTSGNEALYVYMGQDESGVIIDGDTPQKRLENLRLTERLISQRDELIKRMNNPIYDMIKETA